MKLTPAQKAILCRGFPEGHSFILLSSSGEDTVAKNLSNKGLGYFTSFAHNYSWRTRGGFYNHFTPNETGMKLRNELNKK